MARLYRVDNGETIGQINDKQLQFLVDMLEEEDEEDQDYYIDADTLELFSDNGCDPASGCTTSSNSAATPSSWRCSRARSRTARTASTSPGSSAPRRHRRSAYSATDASEMARLRTADSGASPTAPIGTAVSRSASIHTRADFSVGPPATDRSA